MTGRSRAWRIGFVAAGLLVIAVVVGVALTLRDTARPVTVDEARGRTTTTTTSGSGSGTEEPSSSPQRPVAGVYQYEGSGTESLSTPPLSQTQGPTMPATVEWGDRGCWTFRIDFSSNHWQSWTYCPDGDTVSETGGSSWQRWMIGATAITNLSEFTCEQGSVVVADAVEDGRIWDASCTGTSETIAGETVSAGAYRFVGEESVDVGDTEVRTRHFTSERTMSGAQTGTERADVWFADDTGLPVRNERSITAATDTPIGTTTYTEEGRFSLSSTEPS